MDKKEKVKCPKCGADLFIAVYLIEGTTSFRSLKEVVCPVCKTVHKVGCVFGKDY